jgi:tetratricopeptide (TPR) repeat protein/serine/threonine protein kinase
MSPASRNLIADSPDDAVLAELVHGLVEQLQRGAAVDLEGLARAHPQYADRLRELFPTVQALAEVVVAADDDQASIDPENGSVGLSPAPAKPEVIGDYQIVREIGRGGMGIVYEARQVSLNRRVALKVLPFASALDPRALARFQRESLAAAQLDHPQIVPVYGVGADRGVHFYAMRFIEGRSLAQVIAELASRQRPAEINRNGDSNERSGRASDRERPAVDQPHDDHGPADKSPGAATLPHHGPGISTDRDTNRPEYYRSIARLGMQAAQALEYAHGRGILHRDIKPGNLLVDENGNVWITDFGLARIETAGNLTQTGDLLGTLRYTSPEQALGNRGLVDQRADVYALGATLYELLTLRPVFSAVDKAELLRQIASDDPAPLGPCDRAIPGDLETIVFKCLEKPASRRYATAQDLADDLGRFLTHQPIAARPPAPFERLIKWSRRHRSVVSTAAIACVIFMLAGLGLWLDRRERQRSATAHVELALEEALLKGGEARAQPDDLSRWAAALAAARQAEALAGAGSVGADLRMRATRIANELDSEQQAARRRTASATRDQAMLVACEEARLEWANLQDGKFDRQGMASALARAFRGYGIDVDTLPGETAVRLICERPIRQQLLLAILEWWSALDAGSGSLREKLLTVAGDCAADSPAWEKALLTALRADTDCSGLLTLAERSDLPRPALLFICEMLSSPGSPVGGERALALLTKAQTLYPDDFWSNELLGIRLLNSAGHKPAEAVPCLAAAVALRPNSPKARVALGAAQLKSGRIDDALEAFRMALQLAGDYADAHEKMGVALIEGGRLDEGIEKLRLALQLKPDAAGTLSNLGAGLIEKGHYEEATVVLRRALEQKPDSTAAHTNLGNALKCQGLLNEAIDEYQRALELHPESSLAYNNLGVTYDLQGRVKDALAAYRQALALDPENYQAQHNLGIACVKQRRYTEALAAYRRALDLNPKFGSAHESLGHLLALQGRAEDAIVAYRRALEFGLESANLHKNLGNALRTRGRLDEAEAEYRRAVALNPDLFEVHFNLGKLLANAGRWDAAIVEFRRATEIDPTSVPAYGQLGAAQRRVGAFAEYVKTMQQIDRLGPPGPLPQALTRQLIQEGEFLRQMDQTFRHFQGGGNHSPSVSEKVGLAEVALASKRLPALAVRWYREAFESDPAVANNVLYGHHRQRAARAAALAAAISNSDEVNDAQRAAWRQQALEWLVADLEAIKREAKLAQPRQTLLLGILEEFLHDSDLVSIRSPELLNALPEIERSEFGRLWRDVNALRSQLMPNLKLNITSKSDGNELRLEKVREEE